MIKRNIPVCKNCPSLGNHVHLEGEVILVEYDKTELEVMTIEGEKDFVHSWNTPHKE